MTNLSTLKARVGLGPLPPAAARRRRMAWTQRLRHLIQFAFGAFIILTSLTHNLSVEGGTTASIDALCPSAGSRRYGKCLRPVDSMSPRRMPRM